MSTMIVGQTRLNVAPATTIIEAEQPSPTSTGATVGLNQAPYYAPPPVSMAPPTMGLPPPDSTRDFTLSPEMTDCDSADLESEVCDQGYVPRFLLSPYLANRLPTMM